MKLDKTVILLVSFVAVAGSSFAVNPVGPGEFTVSTATNLSFAEESFAVSTTTTTTNYPGIFYPAGGPLNVDVVLWKNVKLTDIKTFTARMGGALSKSGTQEYPGLLKASVYFVTTNANGSVSCQFQVYNNTYLHVFKMLFSQKDDDVQGRITGLHYGYGKALGTDLGSAGAINSQITSSYFGSRACIADLGCILNDDVAPTLRPTALTFENTDEAFTDEELTSSYAPCLMSTNVVVFKNVCVDDIVSVSGEMGSTRIGTAWKAAQGYNRMKYGEGIEFQLQTKNSSSGSYGLYCSIILLTQRGRNVMARVTDSVWGYDWNLGAQFLHGNGGTALATTNVNTTSGIALRNLRLVCQPKTWPVRNYENCLMKGWTKIWPETRFEDVAAGCAQMGGSTVGSYWHVVNPYLWTTNGQTQFCYYQLYYSSAVRSIRVHFRQLNEDVWGRVYTVTWGANGQTVPWDAGGNEYQSMITNDVAATSPSSSIRNVLALRRLTATRPARMPHTVTVGSGFAPLGVPIRLKDVKLSVATAAGQTWSLDTPVHGYGSIANGGAGKLSLSADLPQSVGLEADSGTIKVDVSRSIGGRLKVAAGAALEFVVGTGSRPYLTAESATFAVGSRVVVSTADSLSDFNEDGESLALVRNCGLTTDDVAGLTCEMAGSLSGRYKAKLSVSADGDLIVTIKKCRGVVVLVL